MGTAGNQQQVSVGLSAEMERTFLPRCAHCQAPHPIVQRSPDPSICPDCGMPAQLAQTAVEPAVVAIPWPFGFAFRAAMGAAAALRKLAERIRP